MNTALIRICKGCGVVTAIDMDNTPEHKKDMELHGHTICEVPQEDAMTYWKSAGKCKCKTIIEENAEEPPYIEAIRVSIIKESKYNPKYGNTKLCKCGHPYYRHFDTSEDMEAVGCKHCFCMGFEEGNDQANGGGIEQEEILTVDEFKEKLRNSKYTNIHDFYTDFVKCNPSANDIQEINKIIG
ncbi:MAG: hypothetical protein WC119_00180 [Synergistaceae bacterium]